MFKGKNVVIITDGGLTMGLGHVYRTLSLAKELSKISNIKFLTQSGDTVVRKIKNSGYRVSRIDNIDEMKKWLSFDRPDIIVIDKLEVNEQFAKYIKTNLNTRLIIFGNTSSANKYADVVVNVIIGTDCKNKSFIDKNTETLYLEGPKYVVLRKEFYKHKGLYKFRNNLKRILLIFGGSDPANLTSKVSGRLLSMDHDFKINIVLGSAFKFNKELGKILKKHRNKESNVDIYRDVSNVSQLMLSSDLVITSAGTTMFESFCLCTPTIAFYQNAFQENMFNGFIMTYNLDKLKDFENFIFTIYQNHCKNKENIDELDAGGGKDEIINAIIRDK